MENAVNKTNAWRLVRVLVGELDVDFPEAAEEGRCEVLRQCVADSNKLTA
jgi:hypothetical protein